MKNLIAILSFLFIAGQVSLSAQCCSNPKPGCSGSTDAQVQVSSAASVKAYYFHATRRCATCEAVESVTREALKEYYGDKVAFQSVNIEEEKDNPMIKKYSVSGQTLLFIKGDKVVNLTNDAFMNARTNPDKLKAKIKSTLDPMI